MGLKKLPTVNLFDLEVITARDDEFRQFLRTYLTERVKKGARLPTRILMTPNPEQIMLTEQDREFKNNLQKADWLIPDGIGLVKASRYFHRLKVRDAFCLERISGADIVIELLSWGKDNGQKTLVIGGFYNDLKVVPSGKNAEILEKMSAEGLRLIELKNGDSVWWTEGFERVKSPTFLEIQRIREIIAVLKPMVVLVALGAPEQEKWLVENRDWMSENGVGLGMAVGGSLDFLTGKVSRAPVVLQNAGLEWLFRLVNQPWRWRRQLALAKFMSLVADKASQELKNNKK